MDKNQEIIELKAKVSDLEAKLLSLMDKFEKYESKPVFIGLNYKINAENKKNIESSEPIQIDKNIESLDLINFNKDNENMFFKLTNQLGLEKLVNLKNLKVDCLTNLIIGYNPYHYDRVKPIFLSLTNLEQITINSFNPFEWIENEYSTQFLNTYWFNSWYRNFPNLKELTIGKTIKFTCYNYRYWSVSQEFKGKDEEFLLDLANSFSLKVVNISLKNYVYVKTNVDNSDNEYYEYNEYNEYNYNDDENNEDKTKYFNDVLDWIKEYFRINEIQLNITLV